MKATYAMLALAAGLGEVSATWNKSAKKYSTPANTDNQCDDGMKSGWTWDSVPTGSFSSWNGWDFSGWTCKQDSSKRSLDGRTFGKSISASCGSESSSAPSFGCGSSSDVSSFSVKSFEINVEFDCRMEFHYEMDDGSTCKQSSDCSSQGTTIENTQCGGAKKVKFVYPKQDKVKSKCEITVPKVDFDCESPSTTASVPAGTTTTPSKGHHSKTKTVPAGTTTAPNSGETQTVPEGEESTTPSGDHTKTVPNGSETTPAAEHSTTGDNSGETTPAGNTTPATYITTFDSTSTVYTTTIETITSCAPTITNCPINSHTTVAVVTQTVAISTTVCPVTATVTGPTGPAETLPTYTQPAESETESVPAEGTTTAPNSGVTQSVPEGEESTYSVPEGTTTAPNSGATQSVPEGEESTYSAPEGTTTAPNSGATQSVPEGEESTTAPAEGTTTAPSSGEETTVPVVPTTIITSYDSTSTVYTTNIKTITSCGPTVTNCPINSHTTVAVVTETVAISTTVCPVTETRVETPTAPAQTTAPNSGATQSVPAAGSSSVPAKGTTTAPNSGATNSVPAAGSSSVPAAGSSSVPAEGATTAPNSGATQSVPVKETTIVTSYDSTSTIYTTNIKTITSCGPTVTNCPINSKTTVAVVTETVAISTTICPVTETVVHKPTETVKASTTGASKPSTTGGNSATTPTSGYNVPDVVPSCLNTFLDYVEDCTDNTDSSCYCPNKDFVNKVYKCLYAHGESDDVIAKAVSFFQGICADYVSENPAVGTGAESVTNIITVTGTTVIASAHYTTVTVDTTVTEPCVTGGVTVTGSSTVRTISTEYTVPEVGFTTGSSGSVVVVPPATSAGTAGAGAPYPTATGTLVTSAPAGTGGYAAPTTTAPGTVPVTGGATRTGMGLAAAFLAVALAL